MSIADRFEKQFGIKIAAYKYPRQLEIVEEVPKTVTGKFLRRVLRDRDNTEAKGRCDVRTLPARSEAPA